MFHHLQNILFYVNERKKIVQNVLECLGLGYFITKCNDNEYKRWAKTRISTSGRTHLSHCMYFPPLLSTAVFEPLNLGSLTIFLPIVATVQHELVDLCDQAMEDPNQGILTEGEGSLQLSS
jgi:hypothetical protein